MNSDSDKLKSGSNKKFFKHLARAFGGAILFSFPILMTMEMWRLGFYMDESRLALFTMLTVPLLIGLSYYDGFEPTSTYLEDTLDAFAAYAVGFITSSILLFLLGVVNFDMSFDEIIGKIAIQAIAGSFGAMFAQSLLVASSEEKEEAENRKREASYFGELFLMGIGAIFLSLSVAPTEEINLIAYQMDDWQTLALIFITIALMQAFFFAIEFRKGKDLNGHNNSFTKVLLRFTVIGYAIAVIISFYILWTFGSIDGMDFAEKLRIVVVLAFPAAIGAAASRFIL